MSVSKNNLDQAIAAAREALAYYEGLAECNADYDFCAHEITGKLSDLLAALDAAQEPAAVPAGYALVPVEPTQTMLDAAGMCIIPDGKEWLDESNREVWASMLAAARKGGES